MECLGFLSGSHYPHYDNDSQQRPVDRKLQLKSVCSGWAADDGAALPFANGKLEQVMSSRAGTRGYEIEARDSEVKEFPLATYLLGASAGQQGAAVDATLQRS